METKTLLVWVVTWLIGVVVGSLMLNNQSNLIVVNNYPIAQEEAAETIFSTETYKYDREKSAMETRPTTPTTPTSTTTWPWIAFCWNWITEFGEECDDGNNNPNDECDTTGTAPNSFGECTKTWCGDGIAQSPSGYGGLEQCDEGWHCADGTACFFQDNKYCADGSDCTFRPEITGCDEFCVQGEPTWTGEILEWTNWGNCDDNVDNDNDWFIDCEDSSCFLDPACDSNGTGVINTGAIAICGNWIVEVGEECDGQGCGVWFSCSDSCDCVGVNTGVVNTGTFEQIPTEYNIRR